MRRHSNQIITNPKLVGNFWISALAIVGVQIVAILFSATVLARAVDISNQGSAVIELTPTAQMVGLRAALH
ncbi:MAG: hypothetical protein ACR2HL_02345 [Methylocystis sp.]|jgi:hypothetical protein